MTRSEKTALRKAQHRCIACGKLLPEEYTHVTCVRCLEYRSKYEKSGARDGYREGKKQLHLKRKLAGQCPVCGRKLVETNGYNLMCGICRLNMRINHRHTRETFDIQGLCNRCGKPNDRKDIGRKTCSECAAKAAAYYQEQRALGAKLKENLLVNHFNYDGSDSQEEKNQ